MVAFDVGNAADYDPTLFRSSTIPTAFGSLPNLQRLSLYNAKLTGSIPASVFSSFRQLTYLNMATNQLTGTIPFTINVAFVPQKGTIQLDLSSNYLTGYLPPSVANLQYMYLGWMHTQWKIESNCWIIGGGGGGHCRPPAPGSNKYTRPIILLNGF